MKRLVLMALVSFAVHCQGQGTFQVGYDLSPLIAPGTARIVQEYFESGISFTPIDAGTPGAGFVRLRGGGAPPPDWPNNGTAYLQTALMDSLSFRFQDNSPFGLTSVDLAGFSDVESNFTVQFVGYHSDGSTVTASFSGSGLNFQTFYFGPDFTGLARVEVPTIGWSLDNLVVQVPEPGTDALLVLGAALAAFGCFKRTLRGP